MLIIEHHQCGGISRDALATPSAVMVLVVGVTVSSPVLESFSRSTFHPAVYEAVELIPKSAICMISPFPFTVPKLAVVLAPLNTCSQIAEAPEPRVVHPDPGQDPEEVPTPTAIASSGVYEALIVAVATPGKLVTVWTVKSGCVTDTFGVYSFTETDGLPAALNVNETELLADAEIFVAIHNSLRLMVPPGLYPACNLTKVSPAVSVIVPVIVAVEVCQLTKTTSVSFEFCAKFAVLQFVQLPKVVPIRVETKGEADRVPA